MPGTFSPPQRVNHPDMHHEKFVLHVPWYISGSLTSGLLWSRWRENVPDILGACATRNFTYGLALIIYLKSCNIQFNDPMKLWRFYTPPEMRFRGTQTFFTESTGSIWRRKTYNQHADVNRAVCSAAMFGFENRFYCNLMWLISYMMLRNVVERLQGIWIFLSISCSSTYNVVK